MISKIKIANALVKIFNVFFAISITYVIFNCLFKNPNMFLDFKIHIVCPGIILFGVFLLGIYNLMCKKEINNKIFVITMMGILLLIQLLFANYFAVESKNWDFGMIRDAAISAVETETSIYENVYFYMYPNNISGEILLENLYSFLGILGINNYNIIGIILNICLIDIGIFFTYLTSKELLGERKSKITLLLMCLMTPLITYAPIYYTDTMSIPFIIGAIYSIIKANKSETNTKKIIFYSIAGILLAFGTMLKFTTIIVLIAYLIGVLLFKKEKKTLFNLVLISIFAIMYLTQNYMINSKLNKEWIDRYNVPYTHWIMMGMSETGFYNEDDFQYTWSFDSKQKKQDANIEEIKIRLLSLYNDGKIVDMYTKKIVNTFGDGTYFAPYKLMRQPVNESIAQEYIFSDGTQRHYYGYFSQIVHMTMFIFIVIAAIKSLFEKQNKQEKLTFQLCLFGIMLFMLIWEARSRYLVNYIPVFVLLATYGIDDVYNFTIKIKENIKNK